MANDLPAVHGVAAIITFQLVQESQANASQHSGASQAAIALELINDDQDLALGIKVNGHDMRQARSASRSGLALAAMRERVELVGGKMQRTF